MGKEIAIPKSPVEQILDTMAAIIEKQEGFDSETTIYRVVFLSTKMTLR